MAARTRGRGPQAILPTRDARPGDLKLTKQDVARRELQAAVRLYASGGDRVAVHVLVSAAAEILTAVGKSKGFVTSRQRFLDRVEPGYQELVASALVESFNFMKHGRKDAEDVLTYNPDESEMSLFFACSDYFQIYKASTPELNLCMAYMTEKHPQFIKAGEEDPFGAMRAAARDVVHFDHFDHAAIVSVLAEIERVEKAIAAAQETGWRSLGLTAPAT